MSGKYTDIAQFLRLSAIAHQYSGLANLMVEAATEIESLRRAAGIDSDVNNKRNLVINIGASETVADKEQFLDSIIDAVMGICSCNEHDTNEHSIEYMTARWIEDAE